MQASHCIYDNYLDLIWYEHDDNGTDVIITMTNISFVAFASLEERSRNLTINGTLHMLFRYKPHRIILVGRVYN